MILVHHSAGTTEIKAATVAEVHRRLGDAWVVTDANVFEALAPKLGPRLQVLPSGESTKNWASVGTLLEWLAEGGAARKSELAALGGGVIGDLAGFAASAYMRGVPLIQVPTTLLAMVDSSVGGKTGVDLKWGKNLAGAFWPAKEVLISLDALETLPQREWQCGSAEIWKYGAIMDPDLWTQLIAEPISPTCSHLEETIWRCIRLKQSVVEEDEYEINGRRAILNFGHTVGHAIEWLFNYQELTHGEAISIGMVIEAKIGEELGVTEMGTHDRIKSGLGSQGLPTALPENLDVDQLIAGMKRDKKAHQGLLGMSLIECLGTCKLVEGVSEEAVRRVLMR